MRPEATMHRFEGRVALITGASRGIGLAIAERIIAEGGSAVITARKQEALDAAVAGLGRTPSALPVAPTTPSIGRPSTR
jgi:Short-chain alcohol dehydrogenase of unknown specificity